MLRRAAGPKHHTLMVPLTILHGFYCAVCKAIAVTLYPSGEILWRVLKYSPLYVIYILTWTLSDCHNEMIFFFVPFVLWVLLKCVIFSLLPRLTAACHPDYSEYLHL